MLYERAKQLQSKGLSAQEIHRALLTEGASGDDIKVILGSLGLGPQPQPDPSQQPLVFARRIMESRSLRFALGAAVVGALLYVFWLVGTVVWALVDGLSRGR